MLNADTVYKLPTHGARTYKGFYPLRARSVSGGSNTWHIELNNGDRYMLSTKALKACGWVDMPRCKDDFEDMVKRAVPMEQSDYAALLERAEQLRNR